MPNAQLTQAVSPLPMQVPQQITLQTSSALLSAQLRMNIWLLVAFTCSVLTKADTMTQQEESDSEDEEPRRRGGSARPDADATFGDVFEDLLRPEVHRVVPLWTWAGAAAGMTMGFM